MGYEALAQEALRGVVLAALTRAAAAGAQAQPLPPHPAPAAPIAFDLPSTQPALATPLQLSSPSFQPNGPIPIAVSAYGKNVSPALAWSAGPAATKAYVLIVQDPDSETPLPATHWLIYNIPATASGLPPRMRNAAEPTNPLGALQGWNFHDSIGYTGPRPPVGDPPHHYHFQLFALNRPLRLGGGARLPQVLRAMSGHVLARGELVGTYAQPAPKVRAAPPTPPDPGR